MQYTGIQTGWRNGDASPLPQIARRLFVASYRSNRSMDTLDRVQAVGNAFDEGWTHINADLSAPSTIHQYS
jgi:hypothetical protein